MFGKGERLFPQLASAEKPRPRSDWEGHDFSRAVTARKISAALAAEVRLGRRPEKPLFVRSVSPQIVVCFI
jgi:hypothetical protein